MKRIVYWLEKTPDCRLSNIGSNQLLYESDSAAETHVYQQALWKSRLAPQPCDHSLVAELGLHQRTPLNIGCRVGSLGGVSRTFRGVVLRQNTLARRHLVAPGFSGGTT